MSGADSPARQIRACSRHGTRRSQHAGPGRPCQWRTTRSTAEQSVARLELHHRIVAALRTDPLIDDQVGKVQDRLVAILNDRQDVGD